MNVTSLLITVSATLGLGLGLGAAIQDDAPLLGSSLCLNPDPVRQLEFEWITAISGEAAARLSTHYLWCLPMVDRPGSRSKGELWIHRTRYALLYSEAEAKYRADPLSNAAVERIRSTRFALEDLENTDRWEEEFRLKLYAKHGSRSATNVLVQHEGLMQSCVESATLTESLASSESEKFFRAARDQGLNRQQRMRLLETRAGRGLSDEEMSARAREIAAGSSSASEAH